MAAGKPQLSPIVQAIAQAEKRTTGEIRVHLSRKLIEKAPYRAAEAVFERHGMRRTAQRNAVLLYVNLHKRTFAIIGDEGIHRAVGQKYWEGLARNLREDLQSTHLENAIALAVLTIGASLERYFPADPDRPGSNPDELPNEVTED